jgi:hypothetical protein
MTYDGPFDAQVWKWRWEWAVGYSVSEMMCWVLSYGCCGGHQFDGNCLSSVVQGRVQVGLSDKTIGQACCATVGSMDRWVDGSMDRWIDGSMGRCQFR